MDGMDYWARKSLRNVCFSGPLAINSDGTLIACAQGAFVTVMNVTEPSKFRCFRATMDTDKSAITALALASYTSKKGIFCLRLLCASHHHMVQWNLLSFKITNSFRIPIPVVVSRIEYCSSSCRTTTLVVTLGRDRKVRVWMKDGEPIYTGCYPENFVVSGPVIYLTSDIIKVIDSGMTDKTKSFQHGVGVTSLATDTDGKTFLTHDKDKMLKVWSRQGGLIYPSTLFEEEISAVSFACPNAIGMYGLVNFDLRSDSVCFITAGTRLRVWACSPGGGNFIWHDIDVNLGLTEVIKSFKYATFYSEPVVLYSGSTGIGVMFLSRSYELIFCILAVKNSQMYLQRTHRLPGYIGATDMVFFPGNQFLALAAFPGDKVWVINVASMECDRVVPLGGHGGNASCLDTCMTSDGIKLMVSGHRDGKVRLWEVMMEVCRGTFEGHAKAVRAIASTKGRKGGERIVSCCDGELRMWEIATDLQLQYSGRSGVESAKYIVRISSLVIDPSGKLICSGAMHDPNARLWDVSGEFLRLRWTLEGQNGGISAVEFSGSKLVITASTNNIFRVWDTRTGEHTHHFDFSARSMYLCNGTHFVSMKCEMSLYGVQFNSYCCDGNLRFVSATQRLCDPRNRRNEIRTLITSDDTLATVGGDRITIWQEKLTIWHLRREIDQMNEFVDAYVRRYPMRNYIGAIFYVPGMLCVGRHHGTETEIKDAWLFHGAWVDENSGTKYVVKHVDLVGSEAPRDVDSLVLPSLDGVIYKNVGDTHIVHEFYKHGGANGFTREEYIWCIMKMDSGGIRQGLHRCLEWLVKNKYALNYPIKGNNWHIVNVTDFQVALLNEFKFRMKFTLERVVGEKFMLIEVKPTFDSNFNVKGSRKPLLPDMFEVALGTAYRVPDRVHLNYKATLATEFCFMY